MNDDDDLPTITVDLSKCGTMASSVSYPSSGAVLSTSLTGGNLSWNNYPPTITSSPYLTISDSYPAQQNKSLKVEGDAEITGDLKLNGVNLSERLDKIEERLGILRPNNALEDKWEKLKKLGEEYRKLEKEILEGENIWDMLKK